MSDATQTKTSPPRKRKRSAMTLDTKLKMVREIEKGCSLCSESVHVMYVQVFYSGYIKRYKYKCQCTLNHIYFEELWGCSKIRAFPSYGQCPVPSCPDKGSLSVNTLEGKPLVSTIFRNFVASTSVPVHVRRYTRSTSRKERQSRFGRMIYLLAIKDKLTNMVM